MVTAILTALLVVAVVGVVAGILLVLASHFFKVEVDEKVKIVDVKNEGDKTIYSVTSKAWGVIKADVEVVNDEIKSIIITDSSGETQWNEIEKNNYLYEAIVNQKDIDNLDAVSGSTISSNGI